MPANTSPFQLAACAIALSAALTGAATGSMSDDEAGAPVISHTPEIRFTSGVWLNRLNGEAGLQPSTSSRLHLSDDLGLRDLEPTFNAELNVRKHDFYEIHLTGFRFSTDSSGVFDGQGTFGQVQLNDGDAFRSRFELTSVSAELRFAHRPYGNSSGTKNSDGRKRVEFRISPLLGARYVNVDQMVERIGGPREDAGGEWLGLFGGVFMELMFRPDSDLPLFDRLSLDASAAVGPALGGDGGYMWQVQAGLRGHFTENFGVMFGYRLLELDVENNGYELQAGLQGLFLAAQLTF